MVWIVHGCTVSSIETNTEHVGKMCGVASGAPSMLNSMHRLSGYSEGGAYSKDADRV